MSDSEQCSNRLKLDLISLLVNFACELRQIMTQYDLLPVVLEGVGYFEIIPVMYVFVSSQFFDVVAWKLSHDQPLMIIHSSFCSKCSQGCCVLLNQDDVVWKFVHKNQNLLWNVDLSGSSTWGCWLFWDYSCYLCFCIIAVLRCGVLKTLTRSTDHDNT